MIPTAWALEGGCLPVAGPNARSGAGVPLSPFPV